MERKNKKIDKHFCLSIPSKKLSKTGEKSEQSVEQTKEPRKARLLLNSVLILIVTPMILSVSDGHLMRK